MFNHGIADALNDRNIRHEKSLPHSAAKKHPLPGRARGVEATNRSLRNLRALGGFYQQAKRLGIRQGQIRQDLPIQVDFRFLQAADELAIG